MLRQNINNTSSYSTYVSRDQNDHFLQNVPLMLSDERASENSSYSPNTTEILRNLVSDVESLNNHVIFTDQNLDDFFFIVCGLLVLFMQVGFACLESGSIRSKNVTNIMLKNYLDSFICCIVFWLVGYAFAYGSGNWFIGLSWWATIGMPGKFWSQWFFQFTFASTCSTILSGAVAERCTFVAYIVYSALMSGVIYPIAVHWAWSEQGWLYKLGFKDFAGGMLVHGLAGTACLMASVLIGPRIGRFNGKKNNHPITGHSSALVGVGGIILLIGFCGFNAGTLNHYSLANDGQKIAHIVSNTVICGAFSSLTVLFAGKLGAFGKKFWPFSITVNGGIAGLVASCGGCDVYSPLESAVIGVIAGLLYACFRSVISYLRIDDPLDSSPIHMICGTWSALAVPLVGNGGIIFNDINIQLQKILLQIEGILALILWSLVTSFLLFGCLKILNILRASKEEEIMGMDIAKHRQISYSINISTNGVSAHSEPRSPNFNSSRRISVICATAC